MPNYKGHLVGGCIVYGIVLLFFVHWFSFAKAIEWFCCTLLGSLFPDIDTKSKGQKIFYKLLFIALTVLLLQKNFGIFALLSLIACIPLMVSHRGLCHNMWFILGMITGITFALCVLYPRYSQVFIFDALFFCAGVVSHIFLDVGLKKALRI